MRLFNPLNAELNPICHLLALLAHRILHVSSVRVKGQEEGNYQSSEKVPGLNKKILSFS